MNVVGSLAELEAYFENLSETHPDIKDFLVGDSDKILSMDRSRLNYPCLWLETPEVDWTFGNQRQRNYKVAFLILWNTPTDDWEKERLVKSKTLDITDQILRWIQEDKENDIVLFDVLNSKSMPVFGFGHDNDLGWRTEISLMSPIGWCAPTCKRVDACPVGTLAKFSWENNVAGYFTDLSISNLSLPEETSWTWEWTWQIDDNPEQMSVSEVPAITGSGNNILITLKITSGECERYASAFFNNAKNCGESVPYKLQKKNCV